MRKTRPTLKDIAAALGLSHPTVSRALAGHEGISAETKERVREAAERLGYVVNSSARMLRVGHNNLVGLLVPDITNEFYAAVAQRLADDCSARNQRMLLSISAGDPDRELSLVRALMEGQPAAIVIALTPRPREETLEFLRDTYCVQFLQVDDRLAGPRVVVEDSGGAHLAMRHFLRLGHQRIGFVGADPVQPIGDARLRGVNQALTEAGHRLDPDLIRVGPSTAQFGQEGVDALLALPDPPTALYLSTAPISLGGMRSLSRRRMVIPDALSVIVAGSSGWYDAWPGGLSSITLPMKELADAASILLDRPDHSRDQPRRVELSFQLIDRGSTAPR